MSLLHLLHHLWTKAVGTHDYSKAEWRKFEGMIEELYYADKKRREGRS